MATVMKVQGHYSGYFVYNEERYEENFSLIMIPSFDGKNVQVMAYGHNTRMGPFYLEGHINLRDEVKEEMTE